MMKKIYILGLMVFGSLGVWGQVALPHLDPINYTIGQGLQTQTGWTILNTGDDLLISGGSLTYGGLPTPTGNKVTFDAAGIDAAKLFTQQTTGKVYYSFLLNVTALGSLNTTGGYFTGLNEGTSTIFGATVWSRSDGIGYDIGLNPRTTAANTVWTTGTTAINTTLLVVISYEIVAGTINDVVNLWINPALGVVEPPVTLTATNTLTDLLNLNRILVRQDAATTTPFIQMDELRIGTTWAQVTPLAGSPTVNVTPTSLTGFTALSGVPSGEQTYLVDGANLTNDISIVPPAGFEISPTTGPFTSTNPIVLAPSGGTVSSTAIYVRMNSATLGANTGPITHTSASSNNPNVTLTGKVITTEPTIQSAITIGTITTNSIEVNFAGGDGAKRILVARSGSAVNSNPVDGTTYTANSIFTSGTQIGTGNYVVYAGIGNTVTVTGLSPVTTYHFAVYEYNDAGIIGAENYLTTAPGTGSGLTLTTDGDFRSIATGNWSDVAIWQERVAGFWVAAAAIPISTSNVFIQVGHNVTVDVATAFCNDLHINAGASTQLSIGLNTIEVSGKLRGYTGVAVISLGVDGTFYSIQVSTSGVGATCITSTSGTGKMRVIGNTRVFTATGEWGNNPPGWDVEFAATAGQTLTIQTGFKANNITVASGTVLSSNADFRPDGGGAGFGSVTIKNASILRFSNNSIAIQRVGTASGTSHFGTLTVEPTGTLEFSGISSPIIGASAYVIDGTVIYSGAGNQTMASKGGNTAAVNPSIYANLTVNGTGNKTLPSAATVTGNLALTSGIVITTATNLLTLENGATYTGGNSNTSYVSGPLRKIGNTDFVFPIGKINKGYIPFAVSLFGGTLSPATDAFTAEYIRSNPNNLGAVTAGGVNHISLCDYWTLVRSGLQTVLVTGYWNANNNSCGGTYVDNTATLVLVNFDGTNWSTSSTGTTFINGLPASGDATWTTSISTFGAFSLGSTNLLNPLPISINFFTGTKQNNNHLLNWKVTCNSTPYAIMEMERSTDGRNFTGIYSITADAVRCQQPFDFTDRQSAKGVNYYRLKMTDAFGKISYSSIVTLINASTGIDIQNIAPNPIVNGQFTLKISAAQKAPMNMMITDMQGRIVFKQSLNLTAGFNTIPMNVSQLSAGTYQLIGFTAEGKSRAIRMVIQ